MSDSPYGPWHPMATGELVALFGGAPFRWWITGGVALELYAGRSWRSHADADIGICRTDAGGLYRIVAGLDPQVAAGGRLRPWDGRPLDPGADENNVWVRDEPEGPWRFDVTVGEGGSDSWVYRRDPAVRRDWADVVAVTRAGEPFLAPEIQLLFKSKDLRDKDQLDAEVVIPLLEPHRRDWLRRHLDPEHPWCGLLA